MTDRELSERLCALACELELIADGSEVLSDMARELHELSNVKYSPHAVWADVKKQVEHRSTSKKKRYYDELRKELPF